MDIEKARRKAAKQYVRIARIYENNIERYFNKGFRDAIRRGDGLFKFCANHNPRVRPNEPVFLKFINTLEERGYKVSKSPDIYRLSYYIEWGGDDDAG